MSLIRVCTYNVDVAISYFNILLSSDKQNALKILI